MFRRDSRLRALILAVVFLLALLPAGHVTLAQASVDAGGGVIEPPRSEISEAERAEIWEAVRDNLAMLEASGQVLASGAQAVTFQWPLRAASHLTDYGYHGVSGFVDHNPAVGALRDYTCGTRTYDLSSGYNHQGTDFFTYPFPWLKMDRMEVEVVAAAPGILAFKRDGQYDRQCAMTGALSNAVVIRHADGTLAHYLHMKAGSVTPKPVGAAIAAGEMLGIVGSSGSSTGPHLHFEVRSATNDVIDPYHGPCNPASSMWAEQPPYYDSAVIAVHTGSAPPERQPCPEPEIPNTKTDFEPGDVVYLVTYYRDQLAGQTSAHRVYRPDGTLYTQWSNSATRAHASVTYWYRAYTLGITQPTGRWRYEVDYEGKTYSTTFNLGSPDYDITVTYPSDGQVLRVGAWSWILWHSDVVGDVRIELHADDVYYATIAPATANDGSYFWFVPRDLDLGAAYSIHIGSVADPRVVGRSEGSFTLDGAPLASFYAQPELGDVPLSVDFTDTSAGVVASWLWDFGDGITTTVQHPTHVFTRSAAYTVTLAVSGPAGGDAFTRADAITVTIPPLAAAFDARPLLGTPPLTVTFTDRSTGPPIEGWNWAFGDGVTSTLPQPVHVYTQVGAYTVTLVVTADEQVTSLARPRYVVVAERLSQVLLPVVLRGDAPQHAGALQLSAPGSGPPSLEVDP